MNFDRIFLTGFMGSGKSTVAPRLARGLGYDSVDLDEYIVQRTGLSVPALFDLYGEEHFRNEERTALVGTGDQTRVVVSLGGGALTQPGIADWCLANGTLVYLRGSAGFLASRLSQSRRNRPLLFDDAGKPLESTALRNRVAGLLEQREPTYARAHITIDIDRKEVRDVVTAIRQALDGFGFIGATSL